MGSIAVIGFIAALIGLVYAFCYCAKPTAGMSASYKVQRRRGDKRALLWVYVGFPVVASLCMAIIKAIY